MILTTVRISFVKKMMRDSTRGLKNTRRCIMKVGVQTFISVEMLQFDDSVLSSNFLAF